MKPKETLMEFDEYLAERSLQFEAIVIGGAALSLLGVVTRETQDCDVLDPNIPPEIEKAAQEFSHVVRERGEQLKDTWLNNGPMSLKDVLPHGWLLRIEKLHLVKRFHCILWVGRISSNPNFLPIAIVEQT